MGKKKQKRHFQMLIPGVLSPGRFPGSNLGALKGQQDFGVVQTFDFFFELLDLGILLEIAVGKNEFRMTFFTVIVLAS